MKIYQFCLFMALSLTLLCCGGSDGPSNSPTPEPNNIVPDSVNVALVTPANGQPCTFSRIVGSRAEVDFTWPEVANAVTYRVRVNGRQVYSGADTRVSTLVDFSSQGSWQISAVSIDDVVVTTQELVFTVPARPVVNSAPQPVDHGSIRYDSVNFKLTWDPVVDPDGDTIQYAFVVHVNGQLDLNFNELLNPVDTNKVSVFLEEGTRYEIEIIVTDGTFRRFSTPFVYDR